MQEPGRFSVVIPVYNGARVLERAVASALGQSYANLEVLIVDDGSTDGSAALARRLAQDDRRVVALSTGSNSGGPARPRNLALARAGGEFVAFLDQDDRWFPSKLEQQLAKFRQGDFAVVYADALMRDPHQPDRELHSDPYGELPEGDVFNRLLRDGCFVPLVTAAVRREWVERVGPLDEHLIGADDYEYWLRIASAGGTFGLVPAPLGVRIMDEHSLSGRRTLTYGSLLRCLRSYAGARPADEALRARIADTRRSLIEAAALELRSGGSPRARGRALSVLLAERCTPSELRSVWRFRGRLGAQLRRIRSGPS